MKTKKLLFGLGAVTILASPIIVVTSCGSKSTSSKAEISDIGGLTDSFSIFSKVKEEATKIQDRKSTRLNSSHAQ